MTKQLDHDETIRQRNQSISKIKGIINKHRQINKLKEPFLSKPLSRNSFFTHSSSKFIKQISFLIVNIILSFHPFSPAMHSFVIDQLSGYCDSKSPTHIEYYLMHMYISS